MAKLIRSRAVGTVALLLVAFLSPVENACGQAIAIRPFAKHEKIVRSVAFSPDGKTLFSASRHVKDTTGETKIWDQATGKQKDALPGNELLALSSDGNVLAAPDHQERRINIWDLKTRKKQIVIDDIPEHLSEMVMSPDSKMLATAGGTMIPDWVERVQLWDITTGKEVRRFGEWESRICGLTFSPDGKQIGTCSWEGDVRLWDVASGKESVVLLPKEKGKGIANLVAFSPDGRYIVGERRMAIHVWDTKTNNLLATQNWTGYGPPSCARFSPDGKLLAIGGKYRDLDIVQGSLIEFWEVGPWRRLASARGLPTGDRIWSMAYSPDGTQLAAGSYLGYLGLVTIPKK